MRQSLRTSPICPLSRFWLCWLAALAVAAAGSAAFGQTGSGLVTVPYSHNVNGIDPQDNDVAGQTHWTDGLNVLVYTEPNLDDAEFLQDQVKDFLSELEGILGPRFKVVYETKSPLLQSGSHQEFNVVVRLSPYSLTGDELRWFLEKGQTKVESATNGGPLDLESYTNDPSQTRAVETRNPASLLSALRKLPVDLRENRYQQTSYSYQPLQQVNCRSLVARDQDHKGIGSIVDISLYQAVMYDNETGRWSIPRGKLDDYLRESGRRCVYNSFASIFGSYIANDLRTKDIRRWATELIEFLWTK